MKLSIETKVISGISAALLILGLMTGLAYARTLALMGATAALHQSRGVSGDLHALEEELLSIPHEAASPTVVSGSSPSENSERSAREILQRLKTRVVSQEPHRAAIEHVVALGTEFFAALECDRTTGSQTAGPLEEQIRRLIGTITREQNQVALKREEDICGGSAEMFGIIFGGASMAVCTAGGALWMLRRDSIQRRRVETALAQSERRERSRRAELEAVMQAIPASVLIAHDAKCEHITGNRTAYSMHQMAFGEDISHAAQEAKARPDYEIRSNGRRLGSEELPMQQAAATGLAVTEVELEMVCASGVMRRIFGSAGPLFDEDGKVRGAVSAFIDVTERQRAVEALREREARFRTIFNEAPVAKSVCLPDGRPLELNRAFCQLLGYSEAELLAAPLDAFTHPEDRSMPVAELEKSPSGAGCKRRCKRLIHRSGKILFVEQSTSCVRDANGRLLYQIAYLQDVTEQRRAEEEIRALYNELEQRVRVRTGELFAINEELSREIAERRRLEGEIIRISEREQARLGRDLHDEVSQQLVSIAMMVQLLSNQLSKEAHPRLPDVVKLRGYLTQTIHSARTLAKSFYPVELDKGGLLLALQDLALRTGRTSGVRCEVLSEGSFACEESANIHLYRVVQEALTNAVRHAKPSRIVTELAMREGIPTVTIRDNGVGFRACDPNTQGMGLHLLRYRARMIGARLDVGPGLEGGCEMVCTLPQRLSEATLF